MDRLAAMEVFTRVAEAGSFTAAAKSLRLSKSAVSKRVIELEDHLGVRLFNRTTRRLSLTEVGDAYYQSCLRILADLEEADSAVTRLYSEPRGSLKVNAPMSFGILHLGSAVGEFMVAHPQIHIDMRLTDRFVDIIEEGYDIAIRIGKLADSSMKARRLAPVLHRLCAAPAYLSNHGHPHSPAELDQHRCLLYGYASTGAAWQLRGPDGDHKINVRGTLSANNGDVLKAAALSGAGIALLPTFIVSEEIRAGSLKSLLPEYDGPEMALYAVYPPSQIPSLKVRLFIDFLADRFGPQPYWDEGGP